MKKKQVTLKEYYATKHWRDFRKTISGSDDCVCELCGRKRWSFYKIGKRKGKRKPKPDIRISIHHKHYKSMGRERRTDVIALCTLCHDTLHNLHRLSDINNKTYGYLYDYICKNTIWEHHKRE